MADAPPLEASSVTGEYTEKLEDENGGDELSISCRTVDTTRNDEHDVRNVDYMCV